MAVLERFVTPSVLDPDYKFSKSGLYACPKDSETLSVDGWRKHVAQFPLQEQPELFGMHDNANITFMSMEAEKVLNLVLSIQPREAGGTGGKSPEDIVLELCVLQESRLPEKMSRDTAHPSSFAIVEETGLMISLGTCLTQETARFNLLLTQLAKTIKLLQKAVKGTIVMTGELDDMFNSLLNNQVPDIWTKGGVGYPCLKPLGSWFEDMLARFAFFRDWVENGVPNAYWISSFYFPQGFLTSVLQGVARAKQMPVDVLGWEYTVERTDNPEDLGQAPEEGIYLFGLFMDGCAWDYNDGVLADQEFGTMFVKAPVFNFLPWENKKVNTDKYRMPIYKTSVRAGTLSTTGHSTNFVLPMELETDEDPSYWTLKGAALLTMLND